MNRNLDPRRPLNSIVKVSMSAQRPTTGVSVKLGSCSSKELGRIALPASGRAPTVICSADGRVRKERRGGIKLGGPTPVFSEDKRISLNLGSVTDRGVGLEDGG